MFKKHPHNQYLLVRGACFYHEKVRTLDYKGVRTGILCGFEFYRTAIPLIKSSNKLGISLAYSYFGVPPKVLPLASSSSSLQGIVCKHPLPFFRSSVRKILKQVWYFARLFVPLHIHTRKRRFITNNNILFKHIRKNATDICQRLRNARIAHT